MDYSLNSQLFKVTTIFYLIQLTLQLFTYPVFLALPFPLTKWSWKTMISSWSLIDSQNTLKKSLFEKAMKVLVFSVLEYSWKLFIKLLETLKELACPFMQIFFNAHGFHISNFPNQPASSQFIQFHSTQFPFFSVTLDIVSVRQLTS